MWPEDYYSVVDVFALLGLTRKFLALHAKNFRWCDGWCEESITFFTYSYGRIAPVGMDSMESYRRFRRAWQPKRRKRGTANSGKLPVPQTRVVIEKEEGRQRPVQRKVTGDSDARGNRKGGREERPTVESYRCLRRAWQPKRRKRGTANSGKLPVPQTRVVIEKEEGRQRPAQRKVTGDSDARRRLIPWKVTDDSEARDHIAAKGGY